ncbi:hypothetical protein TPChic_0836a [Treponema pallidum subsp. pallidum str. Chicago]|nr:hypothetical protein TPChic_0836a [Treponema pallidum subsp. pallidum str. Chicago]
MPLRPSHALTSKTESILYYTLHTTSLPTDCSDGAGALAQCFLQNGAH